MFASRLVRLVTLALCLILSHIAFSTCAPPKSPGAVLCFPTNNATVTYPFNIEGAATGKNDLPIRAMILYIDNQKTYGFSDVDDFTQANYFEYSNGLHHAVLNAWDSAGNLYQASGNFFNLVVLNGSYNVTCSVPSSGVRICLPAANSVYPQSSVPLAIAGSGSVKTLAIYVNNKLNTTSPQGSINHVATAIAPTPAPVNFTVVGYNAVGSATTASTKILTYYDGACFRSSCDPGIAITSPPTVTDQGASFTVTADTSLNPHPIVSMRVYLDNSAVLTSTGPSITGKVAASPGTHLITVQAWDTTGTLYKSQETVNVQ